MVKTRRGVNMSGKETKGKKKAIGPSDDACMVVELPVMNKEAQKAKGKKSKVKRKGPKAPVSTSMEEPVLSPIHIRSLPPVGATHEVTQEETPEIHNFYLPWVDYTNIRELDNPRSSRVIMDDDVGGDESHDKIQEEEHVIGEAIAPIVEERVIDSSCGEMSNAGDVSEKVASIVGDDVPEGDSVDVSHVDDMVIKGVKIPRGDVVRPQLEPTTPGTPPGTKRGTLRPTEPTPWIKPGRVRPSQPTPRTLPHQLH
ncbi:hypothetical protein LIER_25361 [Lithospermum erythrorhizon]|uniref:Uncharacterized protein n=1 Tax=Lithospermum erythrorhizon TaxID=34254 RepID=A0AAV3R5S3_LITER